jgi:hypothetical protein
MMSSSVKRPGSTHRPGRRGPPQPAAPQRAAAGHATEGRAAALRIQSLRRLTLDRRRARLLELRRTGVIGDDAFHRLEEELDLADLDRSG